MARNLKKCVDCGNPLSVTAVECSGCKSTDPFGGKRFTQKMQIAAILAIAAIFALAHFGVINPAEIFKNLFSH
ncbi:hypothetical protein [Collimonas silvisoli]|uniref:hypothetical protein n=1 Tax=Collimonas silvisoli TaxID=2825884 RepID=UPI001B8B74A2|nr:hypothetical protein [Collimonas silvisoli]